MRYLWIIVLVVLPARAQNITLPVEVISANDTTVTRTVQVSDASNINRLYLQVHEAGYKYGAGSKASKGQTAGSPRKMEVRVNAGAWIEVHNGTATCATLEADYECIGGAFATVRFTVAISGVTTGANTIDFKFNGTEGQSIGYRVLHFQFLPSTYSGTLRHQDAMPAGRITNTFVYEDPSLWTGPFTDQPSIDAGQTLWETAVLTDGLLDNLINAKCADCHAKNGRDLKFFNYSNHSIIERSKFHSLSHLEGQQIASYIRSLTFAAHGSPWDPPYQPGPTIRGTGQHPDALHSNYWAAGAGLDWVLEDDSLILDYIFPDGFKKSRVSTDSTLNQREIPVAIQFPDWNEWLPRVHPLDAWGATFTSNAFFTRYTTNIPNCLAGGVPNAIATCIESELISWGTATQTWREGPGNDDHFGGWGADGTVADYILGMQQWYAVKNWEIFTSNVGLESSAPQVYGGGRGVGEVRSWIVRERTLFDVAPHIVGVNQANFLPLHGSVLQNYYFSTAWYELQIVVNAGNRDGGSIAPMDWDYQYGHIIDAGFTSGRFEPMRYLKSFIKSMQMGDVQPAFWADPLGPHGFWIFYNTPAKLVGGFNWLYSNNPFLITPITTWRKFAHPILRAHLAKLLKHAPAEWPRGNFYTEMEPTTFTPTPYPGTGQFFDGETWANHYYRAIPLYEERGLSLTLLDSLEVWGESMWPLGDWESLASEPPPSNQHNISLSTGANYVSSYIAPDVAGMSSVLSVVGPSTDLILNRRGGFFTPKYGVNTGLANWSAAQGYVIYVDAPGTLTITGTPVVPEATSVTLDEGWTLVPYLRTSAQNAATALAGITGLVLAKDDAGNVYIPAFGINQIGNLTPGKSYKVFAPAGSFTYPAN